ncbi:HlyC/CorC family transporter [Candidatus Babeliales bacterium]|nr:HlyC/CorC family transporter [Candidatus Babeliales bacterium]
MSLFYIEISLFFVALFFAGLFAFLETAFTALRLFEIKELQVSFSRFRKLFSSWEKNPQRILITILIANNFAHVMSSVLVAEIMERIFGGIGILIGVGIATITILIFGEIIPKTIAKLHNERIFKASLWLINLLFHLLYPAVTFLLLIADFLFRKAGRGYILKKPHDVITEKEIRFLIGYSDKKGLIEAEKSEMLQNIFGLGQTFVNEIMVPKTDMILLDVNSSLQQAMNIFTRFHLSRIPVFEGKEDNIIGMILQKDIFDVISKKHNKSLKDFVRKILFVPETKRLNQLLSEFLKNRMHMAILINEYGGVMGLVTLEDVLEEIVGEIRDEHESIHTEIVLLDSGGWIIDAKISLEKLQDILNITFDVEDSVTLAGFLLEKLQHLPKKGERLFYKNYCFQVQQASSKRVFQVLVFEEQEKMVEKKDEKAAVPFISDEKEKRTWN